MAQTTDECVSKNGDNHENQQGGRGSSGTCQRRPKEDEIDRNSQSSSLEDGTGKGRTFRDMVLGAGRRWGISGEEILDDGEVSDDDLIEESTDSTWIGIGMTCEEKIKALWS